MKDGAIFKPHSALPIGDKPFHRPHLLQSITTKWTTGEGTLYVTLSYDKEHTLREVFCTLGKQGAAAAGYNEAIGRLCSLLLKSGVSPQEIIHQLMNIRGGEPVLYEGHTILSSAHAIAIAISEFYKWRQEIESAHTGSGSGEPSGEDSPSGGSPGGTGS